MAEKLKAVDKGGMGKPDLSSVSPKSEDAKTRVRKQVSSFVSQKLNDMLVKEVLKEKKCDMEIVKELIEQGADPNAMITRGLKHFSDESVKGNSIFLLVVKSIDHITLPKEKYEQISNLFLEYTRKNLDRYSTATEKILVLECAASCGDGEIIKALLEKGVDPFQRIEEGEHNSSAFTFAVYLKMEGGPDTSYDMMKDHLLKNIDKLTDRQKYSAIEDVALVADYDLMKALIEKVDLKTKVPSYAAHLKKAFTIVCQDEGGREEEILLMLLASGIDTSYYMFEMPKNRVDAQEKLIGQFCRINEKTKEFLKGIDKEFGRKFMECFRS